MPNIIHTKLTFLKWFENYRKWISKNPNLISDVESIIKYVSFFTAGQFNSSSLVSEFVYSLPNLMVLFNDQVIKASLNSESKLPSLCSKIKIWLTVIDYTEALFEVSAKKMWGEVARWLIISLIQLLKVIMRLILVIRYKERITQMPAIPPLNREGINKNDEFQLLKEAFFLKRSGKIVRTVRSCSLKTRTWVPVASSSYLQTKESENDVPVDSIKKSLLVGEIMYILKPLLHLGCLSISGPRNWNPWILSFFIDIASLKIFSKESTLTITEREELCRRRIALLLYILRSPFYDNCSRIKIYSLLEGISKTIPIARLISEPIVRYLPHWQNTYFYMWSS